MDSTIISVQLKVIVMQINSNMEMKFV